MLYTESASNGSPLFFPVNFAEERRKEGWDLNDIRFALGHKKVETTIKYLGENNERLIDATDQYYSNNEDLYQIADFL